MLRVSLIVLTLFWVDISSAGSSNITLNIEGIDRTALFITPEPYPGLKRPLVIVLHGFGDRGELVAQRDGLARTALQRRFFALFPEGYRKKQRWGSWNAKHCCGPAHYDKINDALFLESILDEVTSRHAIDTRKIYIVGINNGGMMAYQLAAKLSDRIAAVGILRSPMFGDEQRPENGMPIIMFNSTADPVAPFKVGYPSRKIYDERTGKPFKSTKWSREFWVKANKCELATPTSNKGLLEKYHFKDCVRGEVVQYIGRGGGYAFSRIIDVGKTLGDVMFDFFEKQSLSKVKYPEQITTISRQSVEWWKRY